MTCNPTAFTVTPCVWRPPPPECSGSLKGEHGTGRNVAPFVEMEWGSKVRGGQWGAKGGGGGRRGGTGREAEG